MDVSYSEILKLAAPEALLVLAALVVLFVDMTVLRGKDAVARMNAGMLVTCLGCAAALAWIFGVAQQGVVPGVAVVDGLSQMIKAILLGLTILTALISVQSQFTRHVGEYFALLLFATAGLMFLVSAENLLMIFLTLELASLSLYVLTAFNKQNPRSAEAALKYFMFGAMAAAFTLFGLSLLYGATGEIELRAIAAAMQQQTPEALFWLALVMTVIGFGFKVAAVPFHLWAPDAYQGAPTPSAALIASSSKVASFFILAKVMLVGFAGVEGSGAWRAFVPGWVPLLAVLALLSMILGNLAAIAQSSVKRLLAYSAIGHGGYVLVGVLASGHAEQPNEALASVIFYVTTYALTTIGAFGVVALVENANGEEKLSSFAGFSRRAPAMSFCMLVFMLSLAGIPPLAGFFGKFYVFTAAVAAEPQHLGLLWLVVAAIAMSVVSLYYYLQVLKQIYVADAPAAAEAAPRPLLMPQIAIGVIAVLVVMLGGAPGFFVSFILEALQTAGL